MVSKTVQGLNVETTVVPLTKTTVELPPSSDNYVVKGYTRVGDDCWTHTGDYYPIHGPCTNANKKVWVDVWQQKGKLLVK